MGVQLSESMAYFGSECQPQIPLCVRVWDENKEDTGNCECERDIYVCKSLIFEAIWMCKTIKYHPTMERCVWTLYGLNLDINKSSHNVA